MYDEFNLLVSIFLPGVLFFGGLLYSVNAGVKVFRDASGAAREALMGLVLSTLGAFTPLLIPFFKVEVINGISISSETFDQLVIGLYLVALSLNSAIAIFGFSKLSGFSSGNKRRKPALQELVGK